MKAGIKKEQKRQTTKTFKRNHRKGKQTERKFRKTAEFLKFRNSKKQTTIK